MLILIFGVATIAATWIMAGYLSTQAAITGAVVMTLAVVGVLTIYFFLRAQDD